MTESTGSNMHHQQANNSMPYMATRAGPVVGMGVAACTSSNNDNNNIKIAYHNRVVKTVEIADPALN